MLPARRLRAAVAPWSARLVALDAVQAPVVVGCSGGADSLALLALAAAARLAPVAVHVDHGIRHGGDLEGDRVRAAATRLGATTRTDRVAVAPGPNLEARARDARYGALRRAAAATRATAVLVGHTADDQAETVLLNLLRGAAGSGLAGMAARHGDVVRPLLGLRRADTRELCARLGFAPLHDPMNDDVAFRRVWVRHELLPFLAKGAHRDVVPVLVRQAGVLRDESELLDSLAAAWPPHDAWDDPPARPLAAMPVALARRALRRWLGSPPPSLADVERVLAVARGECRAAELAGGRRVARSRGRLRITLVESRRRRIDPAGSPERVAFALPGAGEGFGVQLDSWIGRLAPVRWPDGRWTCVLDADAAGEVAHVRPVPGGRVALCDRTGVVLWTVGYGVARRARVDSHTRRFLWVAAAPTASRPDGGGS